MIYGVKNPKCVFSVLPHERSFMAAVLLQNSSSVSLFFFLFLLLFHLFFIFEVCTRIIQIKFVHASSSTSHPGGNQVDGLPPVLNNSGAVGSLGPSWAATIWDFSNFDGRMLEFHSLLLTPSIFPVCTSC